MGRLSRGGHRRGRITPASKTMGQRKWLRLPPDLAAKIVKPRIKIQPPPKKKRR